MQQTLDDFLMEGEKKIFDFDVEKKRLLDHMEYLKNMGVEESTFWKKYQEIKGLRHSHLAAKADEIKAKIWSPTDISNLEQTVSEIENLKPRIFYVDPTPPQIHSPVTGKLVDDLQALKNRDEWMQDWLLIRIFSHTMAYDQTPGRFLRFLVIDDVSGKYLGATSISNDVMALTCRDNFIGWTQKNRCDDGKLIHSAIGSCIMGTQPFGYNFLGGKLVATLILSQHVRDTWEKVVGKKLVGMTTTSLYGPNSMYCGIPYWKGCGTSMGKISLKPDDAFYELWHGVVKQDMAAEYAAKVEKVDKDKGPITGIKQRILEMIFRHVGTSSSKYHHGFERGVYYAAFYEQTKDFLSGKIEMPEQWTLNTRFTSDSAGMINWWREKAIKRYKNLHTDGRLKPEKMFYNGLLSDSVQSFDDAKAMFFSEIGR